MRIAIIGAGLAGLSAATRLQESGHQVRVFDKARGVGGRLTQRRIGTAAWDLGAQYFTVRGDGSLPAAAQSPASSGFADLVQRWLDQGVVASWSGRIASRRGGVLQAVDDGLARYVGVPAMQALAKSLAVGLQLQLQTRVQPWSARGDGLHVLRDQHGQLLGEFDRVLLTTPPEQAADLLVDFPAAHEFARQVQLLPCLALCLQLPQALDLPFDGLFADGKVLSWLALEDSKPGRQAGHCWTAHAAPEWSRAHLESDPESLAEVLTAAFFDQTGASPCHPLLRQVHRWRYAIAESPLSCGAWADARTGIALAGDWLCGNRVAGAWGSGRAAAQLWCDQDGVR